MQDNEDNFNNPFAEVSEDDETFLGFDVTSSLVCDSSCNDDSCIRAIVEEVIEKAISEIVREEGMSKDGLHPDMIKFTERLSNDLEKE